MKQKASEEGITEGTLRRAKDYLGVIGAPDGYGGSWVLRLPHSEPESGDMRQSAPAANNLHNSGATCATLDHPPETAGVEGPRPICLEQTSQKCASSEMVNESTASGDTSSERVIQADLDRLGIPQHPALNGSDDCKTRRHY